MTEQTHTRNVELDWKRADEKSRTVPLVISTDTPAARDFGFETLEHNKDSIDLSRSPLPLQVSHNTDELPIGVIENLHIDRGKLRGMARFGSSKRALEAFKDVREGIIRGVSVGYSWLEWEQDDGDVRVTRWLPHEASAVAVPLDINSGFYRSKENKMTTDTENMSRSERRKENSVQESEQFRCNNILTTGRKHDCLDLAQEAIESGLPYADFQKRVLNIIGERNVDVYSRNTGEHTSDNNYMRRNGNREYSLVNAVLGLIDPAHDNGLEREWGQEVAKRTGKRIKPGAVYLPFDVPMTRALDYSTEGADLVSTDHLGGQFIDVLRNSLVVAQAGATILSQLQGNVSIPRKTASSTAYFVDGDGTALTESTPTFDSVTLEPHLVGAWITATHRMLVQGDPAIETMLRQDLADTLAVAMDLACLYGSGTGSEPEGIVNTTGINAKTFAAAAPTYAEVVELETLVAADNAATGSLSYIGDAAMRGGLKTTARDSGSGLFIWDQGNVNGYQMLTSQQATAGDLIFGDFSQLILAFWGGVELAVDASTNFTSGSVRIRALADFDCALRTPVSMALGNDGV